MIDTLRDLGSLTIKTATSHSSIYFHLLFQGLHSWRQKIITRTVLLAGHNFRGCPLIGQFWVQLWSRVCKSGILTVQFIVVTELVGSNWARLLSSRGVKKSGQFHGAGREKALMRKEQKEKREERQGESEKQKKGNKRRRRSRWKERAQRGEDSAKKGKHWRGKKTKTGEEEC